MTDTNDRKAAVQAIKEEFARLTQKRDMHKQLAKDVTQQINELKREVSLQTGKPRGPNKKKKAASNGSDETQPEPQESSEAGDDFLTSLAAE